MIHATIRFHKELSFFLSGTARDRDVDTSSLLSRSVKDLIESFGVPHVEVDQILVNGFPVGFDYLIQDEDVIHVSPPGPTSSRATLNTARFIVDVHLKTLARRLRMLGFDTLYDRTLEDRRLAEYSKKEDRALLSRDTQLLMRNSITRGMYVRSTHPKEQLLEVIRRFALLERIVPFYRCILCNGELSVITKSEITAGAIPPAVWERTETFYRCKSCGKYYWKGSHVDRMLEIITEIQQALT